MSTVSFCRLVRRPFAQGPGRFGWLKGLELCEVDGLRAFGLQISIEEVAMADLVVSVVGDVLRHISVEILERSDVGRIARIRIVIVIDLSAKLIVLLP